MFRSETPTVPLNLYQSPWWARLEVITREAEKREKVTSVHGAYGRERFGNRGPRLDRRWSLFLTKGVRVLAHSLGLAP